MKCPECQNDMIESRVGWLCMNCGHHEGPKASEIAVTPEEASKPVVETTTMPEATPPPMVEVVAEAPTAPAIASEAVADSPATISSGRKRIAKGTAETEDKVALKATPVVLDISSKPSTPETPEVVVAEAPSPTEAEPAVADVPAATETSLNPEPTPVAPEQPSVSVPVNELHAPRAQPATPDTAMASAEPSPEPTTPPVEVSTATAPVTNDIAPQGAPVAKAPLVAATHPQRGQSRAWLVAFGGFLAFASLGSAFYWFLIGPATPNSRTSQAKPNSATVLDAQATPTPSPVATPDVATNDTQRQTDLAAFVAAYKATITGGYFATTPPKVNVDATDPATGTAYVIVTNPPTEIGQIQYMAGGSCSGTSFVPGKYRTRQLALYVKLEASDNLYCLDVK